MFGLRMWWGVCEIFDFESVPASPSPSLILLVVEESKSTGFSRAF